jgi:hypothetical protein
VTTAAERVSVPPVSLVAVFFVVQYGVASLHANPYIPWDDLLVEVLFMAAVWVPLMLLEAFVEYRVKCRLDDRSYEMSRALMYEQFDLEAERDADSGDGDDDDEE